MGEGQDLSVGCRWSKSTRLRRFMPRRFLLLPSIVVVIIVVFGWLLRRVLFVCFRESFSLSLKPWKTGGGGGPTDGGFM